MFHQKTAGIPTVVKNILQRLVTADTKICQLMRAIWYSRCEKITVLNLGYGDSIKMEKSWLRFNVISQMVLYKTSIQRASVLDIHY